MGYNAAMIYVGVALLGLLAGLVVNYFSDVLPRYRSLVRPRCPNCGQAYSLAAYLSLQPCSNCGRPRGRRSYLTYVVMTAATLYLWIDPSSWLGFWLAYILLIFLAVVFVIDVEHRLILHPVSMVGAALGFAIGSFLHGWTVSVLGGAVGFGSMLVLYYLGDVFARYMARRRGLASDEVALGFGDVNLAGIIGLLLGYPLVIFGLLFAILLGGAFSLLLVIVMLIRRKYEAFTAIPYAPFLILSVIYALYR
jgi:leader peptidase (prepilin peptidase) / N-methyltransferase